MAPKRALTAEQLREVLSYDPDTGIFTWRETRRGSALRGTRAGRCRASYYVQIKLGGVAYMAHRLAWLHVHGEWPSEFVDHINGNKSDNRMSNLRLATNSQNQANVKSNCRNTSGVKGVSWHAPSGRWQVQICVNRKRKNLGHFRSLKDAASAYEKSAVEHFGSYARTTRS